MNITRTSRPNATVEKAVLAASKSAPTPSASDAPSIGFALSGQGADGHDRALVGPFSWELEATDNQSFSEFMRSQPVVAASQIWSMVSPSLPPDLARGVNMAWVVLNTVSLAESWSKVHPWTDPNEIAGLTLHSGATALQALSLLNGAAGRPTGEIDSVRLALLTADNIRTGKDPVWLSLHGAMSKDSPIYKASDGFLKVVEAGVQDDPRWKGVALHPMRDLASGDPKLLSALLNPKPPVQDT